MHLGRLYSRAVITGAFTVVCGCLGAVDRVEASTSAEATANETCCPTPAVAATGGGFAEIITHAFDPTGFPPRWHCGEWPAALGWLHIVSDIGIWAAYMAIPICLIYFIRRRKDAPFPRVFIMFGCFIVACGLTHLLEAMIFYWPVYRLAGLLKFATALISWATVIIMIPILPKALQLRSPAQSEALVQQRTAELRRLTEHLSAANTDLAAAKVLAEEATSAKSAFLANMSHEIRTPLTAILGFSEHLVNLKEIPDDARDSARTINHNAMHMLQVLNDILDLSKVEANRLSIEVTPSSLPGLLRDVRDLMRERAGSRSLNLTFELATPIPSMIRTDPTRFRQVLLNVVGNAIKFTQQGSIRVVTSVRNDVLDIDVIDTGIGMTGEQMRMVFEPFMQADVSTARRFGGTGLGLTVSRRLCRAMSGDLTVESVVDQGSTFHITIPCDAVDPTDLTSSIEATPSDQVSVDGERVIAHSLADRRILLADDSEDIRRLVARMFDGTGVNLMMVENGRLAVVTALRHRRQGEPFDVILMDVQMPELDGLAATAQLRAAGYRGSIIAFTANAMPGASEQSLQCGCDAYITKPIRRSVLLQAVDAQIRRSEQRAQATDPAHTV